MGNQIVTFYDPEAWDLHGPCRYNQASILYQKRGRITLCLLSHLQSPSSAQHGDPELPTDPAVHRGHDGADGVPGPAGSRHTTDSVHGGVCNEQRGAGRQGAHAAGARALTAAGATCAGAAGRGAAKTGTGAAVRCGAGGPDERDQPHTALLHTAQGP